MTKPQGVPVCITADETGPIEVLDHDGVRSLYFGTRACQSSMLLYEPGRLTLGYTRAMLAALLFNPDPARILLVGLGGGSLARFLLQQLPAVQITAVESRARVVDVARSHFDLREDVRLRIEVGDGADFLSACPDRHFDLILVDAFDSVGVHPSVQTRAFHRDARRALAPGGAVSVNLWITPGASFENLLRNMAEGFAGQILRLPVEQRANLIALGLDRPHSRQDLKRLHEHAAGLERRYGLELSRHLRSLQRHNGSVLRRLLDLGLR